MSFQKLFDKKKKNQNFSQWLRGEFTSSIFVNHLKQCDISQKLSYPHISKQNYWKIRKNQHIVETSEAHIDV